MFQWLKKLLWHEQTSTQEKWVSGLAAFIYIFLVGFGGSVMDEASSAFYRSLAKPAITPPDWVFSVAWTALFVLIGFAGYRVWNFYESDRARKWFAGLYFINGALIYLWPTLFFGQQLIAGALYAIIGLIIVAELMILIAFKTNRQAAYLLLPYLAWLLFAAYLNISFVAVNS